MTNIDEATGLPELPEGYFWRVRKGTAPFLRVELRKRRSLFGSAVVEWTALYRSEASVFNLRVSAQFILNQVNKGKSREAYLTYLGDYPPKKLEES